MVTPHAPSFFVSAAGVADFRARVVVVAAAFLAGARFRVAAFGAESDVGAVAFTVAAFAALGLAVVAFAVAGDAAALARGAGVFAGAASETGATALVVDSGVRGLEGARRRGAGLAFGASTGASAFAAGLATGFASGVTGTSFVTLAVGRAALRAGAFAVFGAAVGLVAGTAACVVEASPVGENICITAGPGNNMLLVTPSAMPKDIRIISTCNSAVRLHIAIPVRQ